MTGAAPIREPGGMSGETDLGRLLAALSPALDPEHYVFATVPGDSAPAALSPRMSFAEAEGLTLIVTREDAAAHGLAGAFPCRRLTLTVHSDLAAVGLLAAVTGALARAGISVNPVAGFYHDHLFVPEDRAAEAMDILAGLADDAPQFLEGEQP